MTALIILIAVLAIGPLAVRYGADSRPNDVRDRQPHWPAGNRDL
jgi:hypothetical protein